MIYAYASGHMRWHVAGPPESWFVFISTLSYRCKERALKDGAQAWTTPQRKQLGR